MTWPCVFQPVFGHTDAGCCPVAAFPTRAVIRSRPPPPGSAAHRRLEAERRYSSSPRQRRSGISGIRARARVPYILTRFLQPRPARLLKDLVGKVSEEGKRKKKIAGECEARWCNHPPSLSHLSPFQPSLFNIPRDLKANRESRLLSGGWGDFETRSRASGSTAATTVWTLLRSRWRYERIVEGTQCADWKLFIPFTPT